MAIKLKPIGIITRFNGIDIHQTRDYVKISNETYFYKILEDRLQPKVPAHTHPLFMNSDHAYNYLIENSIALTDE